MTDSEHVPGRPDAQVLDLITSADLLIYDCPYTNAEYPEFIG